MTVVMSIRADGYSKRADGVVNENEGGNLKSMNESNDEEYAVCPSSGFSYQSTLDSTRQGYR